jgi:ribose transport system permease protein
MPWREVINMRHRRFDYRRIPGAAYILVAQVIIFGLIDARWLSPANLLNVAYQMAPLLAVSVGATVVILTEGIDLSPGGIIGLAGVAAAMVLQSDMGIGLSILTGLATGAAIGALNGLVITVGGIPPFVATLGTLGITQGVGLVLTQGASVAGLSSDFQYIGQGIIGLPVNFWIALAVMALFMVILKRTSFGTYVYAMGGNREATAYAGINVKGNLTLVYTIGGLLSGVAAILMAAHDNAAHPRFAVGIEFDAIAAVILGGTTFDKGRGGLWGTLVGVATIAFLRNGLNFSGMHATWQIPVIGIVIIGAIAVNEMMQRSLAREVV